MLKGAKLNPVFNFKKSYLHSVGPVSKTTLQLSDFCGLPFEPAESALDGVDSVDDFSVEDAFLPESFFLSASAPFL